MDLLAKLTTCEQGDLKYLQGQYQVLQDIKEATLKGPLTTNRNNEG